PARGVAIRRSAIAGPGPPFCRRQAAGQLPSRRPRCRICVDADGRSSWLPGEPGATDDGHKAYRQAVEETFGADIDYGMLVKLYGPETEREGHERKYNPSECVGAR